ncbi:MAG TPA: hypothetical protein VNY36_02520 [Bacteroidia bacterium]|nr:hypothetical protein [Bacteroidia bacterium]
MNRKNDIFDEENLGKEVPLLSSIPKRNPFTVPEGYFDALPSAIMDKCRETKTIPEKSKLFWLFRPQWITAILICAIAITFYMRHDTPATLETLTAQVSDSTIYQHLQNNIDYVDVNSLEDALQNENVTTVPARTDSTNNQQDIVKYLMDHNVDASDIENEL